MWEFLAELFTSGAIEGGTYALSEVVARAVGSNKLYLRNTLSGELEKFEPINGVVRMYNCGPTVYDRQHIGNLRAAIFGDTIRRTLEARGYKVKQAINITDFGHLSSDADEGEDKMTAGLRREGMALTLESMRELANKYIALYFDDLDAIGVDRKKIDFPRASDHIPQQIELIRTLEQKSFAYQTDSGVYFDTSRFTGYGKLGGIDLGGQQAGARVEITGKRNPQDFVLWKPDQKVGWDSPWSKGFPGWHTECVAMIFAVLGKQIDIHTGGIEHISVHHNNEIAQAEAATGKQFVRYWMHNEHAMVEGKKISKSLGNTVYLSQLTDRGLFARSLRYWYLTGHYRSPVNFTWEAIEGANAALLRLSRLFNELPNKKATPDQEFLTNFHAALAEDLNTAKALALVWDLVKNEAVSPAAKRASITEADKVLGLGLAKVRPLQKIEVKQGELPEGIQQLLAAREAARANKDFEKADEMRQEIESAGYDLKDTPEGPQIIKK